MYKVYTQILEVRGETITVEAEGIGYREIAQIETSFGVSLAEVIKLEGKKVTLQIFAGSKGVSTKDKVRFLGHPLRIAFSQNLLGRIFDGKGNPLDKGPKLEDHLIDINTPPVNPVKRIIPKRMLRTGIPMIDLFNSLVISQKLPIFSLAGEPYNELLARIAIQAKVNIIILGGMGLKYDDYLFFKEKLEKEGTLSRSVFFVHTASEPPVECLLVPDISLAVAENFALEGKDVLVLLTDMTNFCDALKEISITMEQVPSNRGYPGDLYTQLARRYEKAVDFEGAGSITILSATTMPGDDITHPIPDNTGYITEGQLYLKGGVIEPFGSLSRLKQHVNDKTRKDHRTLMDTMIQLFAQYRQTLEKQAMGFQMTSWDKKLLKYGKLFEEKLMRLDVDISLEEALDLGWQILADCFLPQETGIRTSLIEEFWPKR
ncbi:MAG: V-type ATP synthase subunit B [Candidatus Omnitrophica bacterium]|nr:V-type ATP synthase subunit B [Candidatus Omnitrophota bacterium]